VHLNSSKIGGLGAFAGRIAKVKKIIFTAHGFAFNEDRSTFQKFVIKTLTFLTLFFAHKTIVISETELEQVKNWFLISKKITLIHNGISKVDFVPKGEARKFLLKKISNLLVGKTKNIEIINDIMWVGTISELTKNKGLKYAIKSIYELQKSIDCNWDGIFVIIGDGEDKKYLQNTIKNLDLKKKVFFTGFIDNAQMYLKAFDIFLLSSVKEGLPYTLLEAGLAKNAVISTNVGGISEIIDDMKNGLLIRPKNEKEIMNALRYFMKEEKKIVDFGENLHKKILGKFSVEKMLEKTFGLY
jgi:glycosyltransferase involved in cell wall biosynthesis